MSKLDGLSQYMKFSDHHMTITVSDDANFCDEIIEQPCYNKSLDGDNSIFKEGSSEVYFCDKFKLIEFRNDSVNIEISNFFDVIEKEEITEIIKYECDNLVDGRENCTLCCPELVLYIENNSMDNNIRRVTPFNLGDYFSKRTSKTVIKAEIKALVKHFVKKIFKEIQYQEINDKSYSFRIDENQILYNPYLIEEKSVLSPLLKDDNRKVSESIHNENPFLNIPLQKIHRNMYFNYSLTSTNFDSRTLEFRSVVTSTGDCFIDLPCSNYQNLRSSPVKNTIATSPILYSSKHEHNKRRLSSILNCMSGKEHTKSDLIKQKLKTSSYAILHRIFNKNKSDHLSSRDTSLYSKFEQSSSSINKFLLSSENSKNTSEENIADSVKDVCQNEWLEIDDFEGNNGSIIALETIKKDYQCKELTHSKSGSENNFNCKETGLKIVSGRTIISTSSSVVIIE